MKKEKLTQHIFACMFMVTCMLPLQAQTGSDCETPTLTTVIVSGTTVKIKWEAISESQDYKVRYRPEGSSDGWEQTHHGKNRVVISGLLCATTYEFQLANICWDFVSDPYFSPWSETHTFTTGACKLGEAGTEAAVLLAPNPVQDLISLHIEGFESAIMQVDIYNLMGEKVTEMQVELNDALQLDVSTLQSGVYTVIISDGNQSIADQFVKQ
ncbi:MAG: T9SS type A sorting domain-containing protein [Chitinophagales bacterium]